MDGADRVRVLIVGEDPLARGGLAVLLSAEPGLAVAGQSAPGLEAEMAAASLQVEAVLWDLGVSPRGAPNGFGALPGVVALVADEDVAAEALAAGARGVTRSSPPPCCAPSRRPSISSSR